MSAIESKYWTLDDVALYLGFTRDRDAKKARTKVYWLVRRGRLPCYKLGKEILFDRKEVENVVQQNRILTSEEISRAS